MPPNYFKIVLIPLIFTGIVSCSSDNKSANNGATSPTTGNSQTEVINDELTRITANVTNVSEDRVMEVTLGENDVSIMVQLVTADPEKFVLISEIRDPNDKLIYSASIDSQTGEPTLGISEYFDSSLGGVGAASVFLPPTPLLEMMPGKYRISFLTEDDIALSRAEAFVRSALDSGAIDLEAYQAELNIWIAHPDPLFNDAAFEQTIQTAFKDSINTIMAPHALKISNINIFTASADEVGKFSEIDAEDDEESAAACQAMQAVTSNKLALNLVYVRELTASEGGPAGFSPSPGIILNDQAEEGCFFVSQAAYVADPDIGYTQDLVDQMMAGNILHEAGHFMSLHHPSQESGNEFDRLLDTVQCDAATYDGRDNDQFGVAGEVDGIVDDFECGIDGGANNFLFYSGVPHFLPFEMSADQAKVLRRHPLFVKAP